MTATKNRQRAGPVIDPDAQYTAPMVGRALGIKPDTWWGYVSRGRAPEPDDREPLTGTAWWYGRTVIAYQDGRKGQGWRKGVPGGHADRRAAERGSEAS